MINQKSTYNSIVGTLIITIDMLLNVEDAWFFVNVCMVRKGKSSQEFSRAYSKKDRQAVAAQQQAVRGEEKSLSDGRINLQFQ